MKDESESELLILLVFVPLFFAGLYNSKELV